MTALAAPEPRIEGQRVTLAAVTTVTADEPLSKVRLAVVIGLIVALLGLVVTIGADADWLAALGHSILSRGAIPSGVPFAAAPTSHWPNSLVLAEVILNALHAGFGNSGLIVAQLLGVSVGFAVLAGDARRSGAPSTAIAGVLAIAAIGAVSSLAVVRVQMFSLALFPLMIALLRAEAANPSRRIWLALPLLAVWSNLHGAALSGLAILYLYLGFSRFRQEPKTAIAVALAALPALCLTPAGIRTVAYYHGLLSNLAAARGVGQWAPFGHSPFDWVLLAAVAVLIFRMRNRRPPVWELLVMVVFVGLTLKAGRNGVWLIFLLIGPAARAAPARRAWNGLLPLGALAAVALLVVDAGHWSTVGRGGEAAAGRAIALAQSTPILADGLVAEQVAVEGGHIWAGNPIDAFSRSVQAEYLDWLAGSASGRAALANPQIQIVMVSGGSADARLTADDPAFVHVGTDSGIAIYRRRVS